MMKQKLIQLICHVMIHEDSLTRMVSISLRHGVEIPAIIEQVGQGFWRNNIIC
jgi:hypothetical protein